MKNHFMFFGLFLHSFLILHPSSFAAAKPISTLGCGADPGTDPVATARIDAVNPLYVVTDAGYWSKIALTPNPTTWNWGDSDRIVALNYAKGRRIIWLAFVNPDWVAGKNFADWLTAYTAYTRAVAFRYGDRIWAMQVWNEPGPCDPVKQAWGFIPGVTDDHKSLRSALIKMYRAVKISIRGTKIKLAGPAWTSPYWHEDTKILFDEGARGFLDVCTIHDYLGRKLHPDQSFARPDGFVIPPADQRILNLRKAVGNIPIIVSELGLYGQSASSTAHPNTGHADFNSGLNEHQAVRDAILYALLLRGGGATAIIPHVLTNSSGNTNDNIELTGYEFDDGTAPAQVPMKSKTRAFIDTLKLLENLTDAQIKELARLVLSL